MDVRTIFVCGHRNPDCDSVMSAYALADLRRHTGLSNVEPLCAGRLPDRAKWVFDRFGLVPPASRGDVYVRVRDLIAPDVPIISAEMPLIDALRTLEASGESSLPVAGADGRFRGMLSPAKLLSLFIAKDDLSRPTGEAPLHACTQVLTATDRVHDVKPAATRHAHNHAREQHARDLLRGTQPRAAEHARDERTRGPHGVRRVLDRLGRGGERDAVVVDDLDDGNLLQSRNALRRFVVVDEDHAERRDLGERALQHGAEQAPPVGEDHTCAAWLEKICGMSAQSLMDGMMSVASALHSMTPEKAVDSDRKTYSESGWSFSLAQLEESNLAFFHNQRDALDAELARVLGQERLDFVALLVTDPVRGNSELLFRGAEVVRRALPWRTDADGIFLLPGVLSRKKQLLPAILSTLATL